MKGLPLKIIDKIEEIIGTQFDEILMDFLGIVPKLTKEKKIVFTTTRSNLTSLFLQSLGHRKPSQDEEEALKGCLRIASNYIEALKQRTQARAVQNANAYAQETFSKGKNLAPSKIRKIIVDEMEKAQKHLKLIVNSETNKAINTGTALQIQRVAEDNEDKDPTVFFQVTIDDVTGPEEFVLHLLPDRKTPRYWKLSEIGAEYHRVGDPNPKLSGLHPNCFVGNKGVSVFTEHAGYINIKNVKIGDRVLTHTGKFKKVINTLEFYNKKYYGSFYEITYSISSSYGIRKHTLRVTKEHLMMTQRGWVRADELTDSDKFFQLMTKCGHSNNPVIVKPIKEDVLRLSNNHTNNYFFEEINIESVKLIKNGNGGYKLYDLTVEDDESFVVNGVVSHNCRCKLTYLPKGFGHDSDGKIKWMGPDYDGLKEQRKEFPKPR